MLNFYNLSAPDFVELSRDILEKIIGIEIQVTDGVNDRGADIRDRMIQPEVAAQVKHYMDSSVSQLMASIRKEVEKVSDLKPRQYYLFVSKDLTEARIREIIELYSGCISIKEENIFTLSRLDYILQQPEYHKVLEKYNALWNFSIDILDSVVHRNVLFDSKEMLHQATDFKNFVRTETYRQCLEYLDERNIVLLQGNPGSGKTITSKMAALDFHMRGYRVLYSSDGSAKELKKMIHMDDSKELILLDDFLGQIYYSMDLGILKEMGTIITYVQRNKNKCLILNSRMTICREALARYGELKLLFSNIPCVDTDWLTEHEKAQIFKNYLLLYEKEKIGIIKYIVDNKRYFYIIEHRNFNPRVIQYMYRLNERNLNPKGFYDGLMTMLDHPDEIWKDEFENRLGPEDRIFLLTLYSLSNSQVAYEVLEECFYARILNIAGIDKTVNQMVRVLERLKKSMVEEIISDKRYVKAINPSVNDFLNDYIKKSSFEKRQIIQSAVYFDQIRRVSQKNYFDEGNEELKFMITQMIKDGTIMNYKFEESGLKGNVYLWNCIIKERLQDIRYKNVIIDILRAGLISHYAIYKIDSPKDYLLPLFQKPLVDFYEMDEWIRDIGFVKSIIKMAGDNKKTLEPVLSALWGRVIERKDLSYDLDAIRKMAFEAWIFSIYNIIKEINDFMFEDYDWSEYEQMVASIDNLWHTDDIIRFCEDDLYCFLEEDIKNQYERYANEVFCYEIGNPDWMTQSMAEKAELDTDILWIDQDIYTHVENAVDNTMSDLLPEQIYDEYTGNIRERQYDMSLDRQYYTKVVNKSDEREKIDEIFNMLNSSDLII